MNTATAIAFPVVASIIAVAFVYRLCSRPSNASLTFFRQLWQSTAVVLVGNVVGSLAFGAYLATRVFCCSTELSYWVMPLVFAPLEYWSKFGLAIAIFAVISAFVVVKMHKRLQATSPK